MVGVAIIIGIVYLNLGSAMFERFNLYVADR